MTVTTKDAEIALWLQGRAIVNRANGCPEAADQLEALARSLLGLAPKEHACAVKH